MKSSVSGRTTMLSDFDYDVMQKKRIASGDRHRKRGSKSKFCGLPSDHMTEAQWKKQNGEVKVMNLSQPMTWGAFQGMPCDLQKEYVEKCVRTFGCALTDFAALFGVTTNVISRGFKKSGVYMGTFRQGKRMSAEARTRFDQWRGAETAKEEAAPSRSVALVPAEPDLLAKSIPACTSLKFVFDGEINYAAILQVLYDFANGGPMHLEISAEKGCS